MMGAVALYNCTMFGNEAKYAFQNITGNAATNCVIVLSSTKTGDLAAEFQTASDPVGDSVLASTASKGYVQFMAPGFDDFRLRSDSDAIGAGRAAHLSTLSLPAGIDAFKDFAGETIVPDAEGRIHAGAIQATATPAGGALVFKGGTYEVDGVTNSVMTYVCPAAYPTQYCVRAVLDEGQHLFRIHRYDLASGAASTNLPAMVPFRDGSMWMMPPPDPSVGVLNVMQTADTVKYVDPNPNVGSDEGTGAADSPYATIQKAMDAADRLGVHMQPGPIFSRDAFYKQWEYSSTPVLQKLGVMCVEMESYALYLNAAAAGKNALTLLTISDSLVTGQALSAEDRQNTFTRMMEIALEIA